MAPSTQCVSVLHVAPSMMGMSVLPVSPGHCVCLLCSFQHARCVCYLWPQHWVCLYYLLPPVSWVCSFPLTSSAVTLPVVRTCGSQYLPVNRGGEVRRLPVHPRLHAHTSRTHRPYTPSVPNSNTQDTRQNGQEHSPSRHYRVTTVMGENNEKKVLKGRPLRASSWNPTGGGFGLVRFGGYAMRENMGHQNNIFPMRKR